MVGYLQIQGAQKAAIASAQHFFWGVGGELEIGTFINGVHYMDTFPMFGVLV